MLAAGLWGDRARRGKTPAGAGAGRKGIAPTRSVCARWRGRVPSASWPGPSARALRDGCGVEGIRKRCQRAARTLLSSRKQVGKLTLITTQIKRRTGRPQPGAPPRSAAYRYETAYGRQAARPAADGTDARRNVAGDRTRAPKTQPYAETAANSERVLPAREADAPQHDRVRLQRLQVDDLLQRPAQGRAAPEAPGVP